jgi:phosphosulfolactate phosphohydrolase-like enzyme
MNERIEQLMKQAGTDSSGKWMGVEHAEKFAELIVAECLEACSRANEIRHFVPPTQEQVVLSCMREIETTFRS